MYEVSSSISLSKFILDLLNTKLADGNSRPPDGSIILIFDEVV